MFEDRIAVGNWIKIYKNHLTDNLYVVCLLGETEQYNREIFWGIPEDIDEWLGHTDWNHGTGHERIETGWSRANL